MTSYVWKDGGFVNKQTGEPMDLPYAGEICAPRIMSDIPEYRSPIDGKPITSRSHRRYDLEKNDCVEIDPPREKRGYRNRRFAEKRGLPLAEDVAASLKT